jgi:short-subunit dehydrogenase
MPRREIAGSRALVTGASGGLGRALALELARHGADVVLLARRPDRIRQVADEVRQLGGRTEGVVGDVTQAADRAAALQCARDCLGGLDILVNNAGAGAVGRFETAPPERLRQVMEVNCFAAADFTREALPLLRQGRRPIVVNIASILSYRAVPRYTEYVASKFALRGWSNAVRPELTGLGIDLLLVNPGPTRTEFWDHLIARDAEPAFVSRWSATAESVARRTIRACRRGRREVFPDAASALLYWIDRLAPWALDRFARADPPRA